MSKPEINSNINPLALERLAEQFGDGIVLAFAQLEIAMKEMGGVSFTGNVTFLDPTEFPSDGELIPSIHLSLQPFFSNLSVPINFEDEGESDDSTDSRVRDGATG